MNTMAQIATSTLPAVLAISGSDSSGGAGMQADLKTMLACGVFGMSAITALTAQNTTGVRSIQDTKPDILADQINMVFEDIPPVAVKIGMVSATDIIDVIAERLTFHHATNIVLDPVFIFVLHLGVRGAAIATVISQTLSALWVLRFLTGRQAELKIGFRGFQPDFACIRRIATLGVSSFVMSFTDSLVQIACNATLLTFGGDIYISVMTVLNSVRQIAQTPVMAIADGATAVISFNYGAKAYSRVRGAIRFMTQLAFGYTALSWLLISLFPAAFIRIFNQDAAMLSAAIPSLHIYFFGFVMMAFQYSGQSTFKSLNRAGFAVFFSLLRKAFIVVPLTLVLPRVAGLGVNGVFAAEPISNLIGGLACYITMRCTVMRELEHRESVQRGQVKK